MGGKTDRRVIRTKRSIREAFVQLIGEKELNQITVAELARLADIDRKTFYLHYATVVDVYQDLLSDVSRELEDLLADSAVIDFASFFTGLNRIMKKDMAFYQTIAEKDSYGFLIDECTALLDRKLTERYSAGGRELTTAQQVSIAYASSGIIGVYINWLRSDKGIALEQLSDALGDMAQASLSPLE